jgi:hypothetical protein
MAALGGWASPAMAAAFWAASLLPSFSFSSFSSFSLLSLLADQI